MAGSNKTRSVVKKYPCINCSKEQAAGKYYISNNEYHRNNDNRFPVCKTCFRSTIDTNDLDAVRNILSQMNRPFLFELWERSKAEAERMGKDLFGIYYKNIMLNNKELSYKNSVEQKSTNTYADNSFQKDTFTFQITPEMIIRWGQNYEADDYMKLEDFYHNMKKMNKIETPQEETYLKKLSVISLKMDQELEAGNYGQVKQLGDLFSKYMADSKFRAMDKTDADKTGGIRSFGAIFAEVEAESHIPPWEEFRKIKGLTQDLVDKTIMHIENFTLRLNKIERMVEPPSDTPKITDGDV